MHDLTTLKQLMEKKKILHQSGILELKKRKQ